MNITVWGINYAPEVTGIGPYNKILCDSLQQHGNQVRMVAGFSYYPLWKKQPEDRRRVYRTDTVNGVEVHRCWQYVPSRPSALKRILHEASFILTSFLRLLVLPRPDLLVVVSPPLALGAAAALYCWLRRTRFVFHVQDLQPDAAVGLGMVKPGMFTRMLYRLEALAYRAAHRVSGISDGMLDAFKRKGLASGKIVYFPNGVRLDPVSAEVGRFRSRNEISAEDFLVVYSGNLGVKQGLEVVVEAAAILTNPRIKIVICGDGAAREALAAKVRKASLSNVLLVPLQDDQGYREMLCDADVSLITQQRGSGAFFFPSKLLSNLAFGKPVLTVADESSELGRAIRQGEFGINVVPGQPGLLAQAFEYMASRPSELRVFAAKGSRFVAQFELERVMRRYRRDLSRAMSDVNGASDSTVGTEEDLPGGGVATSSVRLPADPIHRPKSLA